MDRAVERNHICRHSIKSDFVSDLERENEVVDLTGNMYQT